MHETQETYEIKLPQFEGPFDLLLFFIERDELDVYDIPITKITTDFLNYLREAHVLNIELASEFIVVAATLMRIKAKLLLPRKEKDEHGNETDPRDELVKQLLEYKRYKEVLDELRALEDERSKMFARGNTEASLKAMAENLGSEGELHSLTLFKLMHAFEKAMNKFEAQQNRPVHHVIQYAYSIETQKNFLKQLLQAEGEIPFARVFESCITRIHAVFTLLAILEMIQQKFIVLKSGIGMNNFRISAALTVTA